MTDLTIPDEAIALAVSVGRNTDSADGPAVCEAIVRTAAPLIVAAELRRNAADYQKQADRERERSLRLGTTGAPKWQHEASIASAQELASFVKVLNARADALDPDGAAR